MSENEKSPLGGQFERANPSEYGKTGGDAEKVRAVDASEARRKREHEALKEQATENRREWVAKHVEQIWLERERAQPELNPPIGPGSLTEEANRRVDRDIEGVRREIDRAHRERVAAILSGPPPTRPQPEPASLAAAFTPHQPQTRTEDMSENSPSRAPAHPLKREVHAIMDRGKAAREKAARHFYARRAGLIETAKARGAENPEKDVNGAQAARQKRIHEATHRMVHRAFVKHGIDRAPSETQGRTQQQTQTGPDVIG